MEQDIQVQKGLVKDIQGKKIEGKVIFSDLEKFQAKGLTKNYSLKYVLEGKEEYIINNTKKKVYSGQFLMVEPGQNVETKVDSLNPAKGICIYFPSEIFEEKLTASDLKNVTLPEFPLNCNHLNLHDVLGKKSFSSIAYNPDYLLQAAMESLVSFLSKSQQSLHNLNAQRKTTQQDLWRNMEMGKRFIDEHMSDKISLSVIAEAACLSPFHFQRVFKAFYGVSPSRYLYELRLNRAKGLLSEESNSIEDVAFSCGFNDVKYFKKCLKDHLV